MPEKPGDGGDESWTQTLITVTPEEDASIRTITGTTVISGVSDTALELGVNQIADRRTVQINTIRRELFADISELEEKISYIDAECQTLLGGLPDVELPSVSKDEATQTIYLGNFSPLHVQRYPLRDFTRIMNERITPVAEKRTVATQTVVTFEPDASRGRIVARLSDGVTTDELREENRCADRNTAASTYVTDNLYFILDRVFWMSEPGYLAPKVELKNEDVQTSVKYDYGLGKIVLDADTQTSLTCEPRQSNTGLLSEWSATRELARDIVGECLEIGVYPRAIVHSIVDEVVERCADQIHLPYRDKAVQTLAPCNALVDKDDEVLRKLRLRVVLDTLESSIIVLPLVEILLEGACLEIRLDAHLVASQILNRIQKNSVSIAARLAEIRREAVSHKPVMDDIFEARRKRLRELLRSKAPTGLSSGTQTELAGIPEITKIKEPKETVCSACSRHSECYACGEKRDTVDTKILRTQDILIACSPCYVVATPSEAEIIRPPIVPKPPPVASIPSKRTRPRPLTTADHRVSARSSTRRERNTDEARPRLPGCARLKGPGRAAGTTDTSNDWARVARGNDSISGVWSIRGSSSADGNTVVGRVGVSSTCLPRKSVNRECARVPYDLPLDSAKALRVLRNTFHRNEESCSDCTYDREKRDAESRHGGARSITSSTCDTICGDSSSGAREESEVREPRTDEGRPYGQGVRVVPIVRSTNRMKKK